MATLEKEKQILRDSESELRAIINQSVAEHHADVRCMIIISLFRMK